MTWSESSYKLIIDFEKNNRKKEKKTLEKISKNETKIRKKIMKNQRIENEWIWNIYYNEKKSIKLFSINMNDWKWWFLRFPPHETITTK